MAHHASKSSELDLANKFFMGETGRGRVTPDEIIKSTFEEKPKEEEAPGTRTELKEMPEPIEERVEEEMDDRREEEPGSRAAQSRPEPEREDEPEDESSAINNIKRVIRNKGAPKSRRNVFVLPGAQKNMSVPRRLERSAQSIKKGDKKLRILNNSSVRKSTSGQNLFRSLTRSSQTGGAHSLKIIKTIIRSKKEPERMNNVTEGAAEREEEPKTPQRVVQVSEQDFQKIKNQKSPSSQNLQMSRRKLTANSGAAKPDVRIKKRKLGKLSAKSVSKKTHFKTTRHKKAKRARKTTKAGRSSMSISKASPKSAFPGHRTLNFGDMGKNLVLEHLERQKDSSVTELAELDKGQCEVKSTKTRKKAKRKKAKYDRSIGFGFRKQKHKN